MIETWVLGAFVESDVKARMLRDIELELSALPVEDLPVTELVQIAIGIRDRHYREVEKQRDQTLQRQGERERLMRHGNEYVARELREVDGLNYFERTRIEARIKRELDRIGGDETEDEIEDLIEDILEDEGIEPDDDE